MFGLSNLFISWGWSRDDLKLRIGQLLSVAGAVVSGVLDPVKIGAYLGFTITVTEAHWVTAICIVLLYFFGKLDSSPLPSAAVAAANAPKSTTSSRLPVVLIAAVLGSIVAGGCASVPVKQQATIKLQGSESVFGTIQDAERVLCSPTADKTKMITHCDGQAAATAGLTDVRHQAIEAALGKAFGVQDQARLALQAWKSGDPVPTTVAALGTDLSAALAVVQQLTQNTAVTPIVTKLQQAIDGLTAVAQLLGGK